MQSVDMLKSVGYWPEKYDEYAPPFFLIDSATDERERWLIVNYLDRGEELFAWLGFSHCRFRCGISNSKMGCRDLTDGVWVWPEGLSHYIKEHSLGLPVEFVEHMRCKDFSVSVDVESRAKIDLIKKCIDGSLCTSHDSSIWTAWLKLMGEVEHFQMKPIGKHVQVLQDHLDISLDDLFGK